jgi:hypothetical protein
VTEDAFGDHKAGDAKEEIDAGSRLNPSSHAKEIVGSEP